MTVNKAIITPAKAEAHTLGPWFVSGVRFRMNGGEWHSINRYDESKKQDENIAYIPFDPRTGDGLADAHLIAATPDLLQSAKLLESLCAWLLHRFGRESPEGQEAKFRLEQAQAVLNKLEGF